MACEQPSLHAATIVLILRTILVESGDITLVYGDEALDANKVNSLTSDEQIAGD